MGFGIQIAIVIFAIAVFVVLTVKGLGPIVSGLIAGAIVSLIAIGGFKDNFFGTFLTGMTDMFGTFFILFSCGMAFGGLLAACGASDRLGTAFIRLMGEKNFIIAIVVVAVLFGLTGAPPLALMPPLCFGMLKKANLPRYIGMTAVAGSTSLSLSCFPGTLGSGNVVSANLLGASVYSAPGLGLLAVVVGGVLLCLYLRHLINEARKKGIGYDAVEGNSIMGGEIRAEEDMPSFIMSFIPVILILGGSALFIIALHMESLPAVTAATLISCLFMIVANRKYFYSNILETVAGSVFGIQGNIIGCLAVCGFAAVIANTEMFQQVVGALLGSSISPILLIVVAAFITAALCADSIGGVAVFSNTAGQALVSAGVNVQLVHRLANITSTVFDSMPHGGSVILALSQFGYNHKQAYKYIVVSNIVIPFIYTIICAIVAVIAF